MPIIPTHKPQVGQNISRTSGGVQSQLSASPVDFGAQEAADLSNFAQVIQRESVAQIDRRNKSDLLEADNKFQTKAREINLEAQRKKGKNAEGAVKQAEQDLKDARATIYNNMATPAQKRAFDNSATRTNMDTLFQIKRHEIGESFKTLETNRKASLYNIGQNVKIKLTETPKNYYADTMSAIKDIEAKSSNSNLSEEANIANTRKNIQDMHIENIKVLVKRNPALTVEYIGKFKKQMASGVAEEYLAVAENATAYNKGNNFAVMNSNLSMGEFSEKAKTIKDDKERSFAKKKYKSLKIEADAIQRENHNAEVDKMIGIIRETPLLANYEDDLVFTNGDKIRFDNLRDSLMNARKAGKQEIETDYNYFGSVMRQTQKQIFDLVQDRKLDLSKLGTIELNQVEKVARDYSVNKPMADETAINILKMYASLRGGISKDDIDDNEYFGNLYYRYTQERNNLTNEKDKNDPKILRGIANGLVAKGEMVDQNAWLFELWDTDVRGYESKGYADKFKFVPFGDKPAVVPNGSSYVQSYDMWWDGFSNVAIAHDSGMEIPLSDSMKKRFQALMK